MASGVAVDPECVSTFNLIKEKSDKKNVGKESPKYAIFCIESDRIIKVEEVGDREKSYDDFVTNLTKHGDGDCRYGVYDYPLTVMCQGAGEATKDKLVLFSWCPDSAKIKKKMIYSSSFDGLKKKFVGIHVVIQANDMDTLSAEYVEDKLRSTDRS